MIKKGKVCFPLPAFFSGYFAFGRRSFPFAEKRPMFRCENVSCRECNNKTKGLL